VCVNSKTHFFLLTSQIWITRIYLPAARVRKRTGLDLNAQNIHKKIPTHPLTHTHTHMHTRTHAHRREMGDVRAHAAIYTNTLLHVYLTKYPSYRTAHDLQPRRRGHSASTRATCHTPRRSSPGARAHSAPTEREPQTHGNFRNRF